MRLLAPLKGRVSIAVSVCALFSTLGTGAFAQPQIAGGFVGGVAGGGPKENGGEARFLRRSKSN
jgi:hypothetical protein